MRRCSIVTHRLAVVAFTLAPLAACVGDEPATGIETAPLAAGASEVWFQASYGPFEVYGSPADQVRIQGGAAVATADMLLPEGKPTIEVVAWTQDIRGNFYPTDYLEQPVVIGGKKKVDVTSDRAGLTFTPNITVSQVALRRTPAQAEACGSAIVLVDAEPGTQTTLTVDHALLQIVTSGDPDVDCAGVGLASTYARPANNGFQVISRDLPGVDPDFSILTVDYTPRGGNQPVRRHAVIRAVGEQQVTLSGT